MNDPIMEALSEGEGNPGENEPYEPGPEYCDGSGVVGIRAACCMQPDPRRPDECCNNPVPEEIPCDGCAACRPSDPQPARFRSVQ